MRHVYEWQNETRGTRGGGKEEARMGHFEYAKQLAQQIVCAIVHLLLLLLFGSPSPSPIACWLMLTSTDFILFHLGILLSCLPAS